MLVLITFAMVLVESLSLVDSNQQLQQNTKSREKETQKHQLPGELEEEK